MTSVRFAWHVHHGILVEPLLGPISVRRRHINEHKPKQEIAPRQRLLKSVKGPLPTLVAKAGKAYDAAGKAYAAAWKAHDKALKAYDKALKAYAAALKACQPELLALHAQECPDCPWDGKTIFPTETAR